MAAPLFILPDNLTQDWLGSASLGYNVGDLCYTTGSDVALPAGNLATAGTEAADQLAFASKFIGVCSSGASAAETAATLNLRQIVTQTSAVMEYDCPSQTFAKGDYVGIYSDGVTINPAKVDACGADSARAIGRVVRAVLTAATRVRVIIEARKFYALGGIPSGFGDLAAGHSTLADGAATISLTQSQFIRMTPTANRTVTLPTEATSAGLTFIISNLGSSANQIILAAPNSLLGDASIAGLRNGIVMCDGASWVSIVSV